MKVSQIRKAFLDFFESKGHHIVPSAGIVVKDDPTLMFTNAGMNQFKDIFLGNERPSHPRVADSQKCLRVSGKHNDLEEVGVDTYHHTMFEMLGNWSFADYYKSEAIAWAWELLTEVFHIPKERLYVTIFKGDEADGLSYDREAHDAWKPYIAEERILPAGKKDNFWEMGEVGPCGPCSEIHVDMRSEEERRSTDGRTLVNADHPQVIEIWNLVFMELARMSSGKLVPLAAKHIDTGMGLERLAMVLQNKRSTYETDIFSELIAEVERCSHVKYTGSDQRSDVAMRVMADHVRAVSFAIADGQLPANTGPGYVIRRILRRAVRYAYSFLHINEPALHKVAQRLIASMGDFYQELQHAQELILTVIKEEEESFLRTLARGMELIEARIAQCEGTTLNGSTVFELYDTYGFPVDLTALILHERGMSYDTDEFDAALDAQKTRSRAAGAQESGDWVVLGRDTDEGHFVGYDQLRTPVRITRYREVKQKGKRLFQLVLDRTPFYPEGGGQVGDTGYLVGTAQSLRVRNTLRENKLILHLTEDSPAGMGETLIAEVDAERRLHAARNHSATHLLHYVLRQLLGTHVEQRGSLVSPEYLRFDFSHYTRVDQGEIRRIEAAVNELVRQNIPLEELRKIPLEEAMAMGAMALFGEKYGSEVRVIKFGNSVELCGGTHLQATGAIGYFKITSEMAVASGVRRIEALSGAAAQSYVDERLDELERIKLLVKDGQSAENGVERLLASQSQLSSELDALKRVETQRSKEELVHKVQVVNGVNMLVAESDLDMEAMKDVAFQLRTELSPLYLVLGQTKEDKATLVVALSDELSKSGRFNAASIVRELAAHIAGGGGGQAFFATAGGKNTSGVKAALEQGRAILSQG